MMTLKILAKCSRRIFFDSPQVLRNSTPAVLSEHLDCCPLGEEICNWVTRQG